MDDTKIALRFSQFCYPVAEDSPAYRELANEADRLKRESAVQQANNAGYGLLCHLYKYHTDYFIDKTLTAGEVVELIFDGT